MKKSVNIILTLVLVVGVWLVLETGGYMTYDYGLDCTRCLLDRHVVEKRLFGCTVSRRETVGTSAQDYERLFGHPCEHVFRKGSFGRGRGLLLGSNIACGLTAEGALFRYRLAAMQSTYDADLRFGDSTLALRTFSLIDGLLPADTTLNDRKTLDPTFPSGLFTLADKLRKVNSTNEWQQVLEEVQTRFANELETVANQTIESTK